MGSLETDFAALMQSHTKRNLLTKERAGLSFHLRHILPPSAATRNLSPFLLFGTDKARRAALATASVVVEHFVDCMNGGVQEVFVNEKRIELEARALKATVQRFSQQSNQWLTVFQALDSALKEIGDFENWIKVMEKDCEIIGTTLKELTPPKHPT